MSNQHDVVIVGAGFTGLTAGLELARAGRKVLIIEKDDAPGGLAGTFEFKSGVTIEKFYHHWFNNDVYVPQLARELGLEDQIVTLPSRTGMYFNGKLWRLSTPLDLLKFSPLSLLDRIRLGLLVFKVRQIKDWKTIEHLSIREWLEPLCGKNVFRIVWEPLIESKFSVFADAVNAVWFWKKLVLRGSTRDKQGGEQLAYFKGGFGRLAQGIADEIIKLGGEIRYRVEVTGIQSDAGRVTALNTKDGELSGREFLLTPSFAIIAKMFEGAADEKWLASLRRVNYLGNMCLVLQMDRSLSDTYWLNVNDPGFPFVGVIEHTNFDPPENYDGKHIVFISRYLATQDPVWSFGDKEYLDFAVEHLQRMFPEFNESWVKEFRVWRAEYAQPVTERNYSKYVPKRETPYSNAIISTMAQIYPEDRGTNYAIREGKDVAAGINARL
ncbi:NAD(P)/FAD-dependent oxidoreductase [Caballeronia sp. SBC2]|uniref:NAD(P)/FAD-dependent oxidoreductase n=1 Tax=Caballeronia sp. SBC2 TaxID=2705547 RepID=UPI0013E2059E|nr:NAD(P)/FAD-dependent oxidoreductase [Caballeronia sp. SBC2]QIE24836.1 Flavin containing amine oxidoreductase [Caballeronia sp. SBC2]